LIKLDRGVFHDRTGILIYQKNITPTRDKAALLEKVDLVVGIPFLNSTQDAHKVMETVGKGLTSFLP
jgi:predicted nucleotidyltransferase